MSYSNFSEIGKQIDDLNAENASLQENLNDLAMRLDTVGWIPADGWDDNSGMALSALQQVSKTLQDMAATAPVLGRAVQLRHGYVFGRGMDFVGIQPRHQNMMDDPYNKQVLFTNSAHEELMRTRLTDGNWFVLRHKQTNQFYRIPMSEITGVVTDPMSAERIWFLQRTYTKVGADGSPSNGQTVEWYPLSTYTGNRRASIKNTSVNNAYEMFHMGFNKQVGWTFGVPDAFAAMTWVKAYSEYLKNNSKLVKAYAQIAYKASTSSKKTGQDAAVQIAQPGGIAGTALMGANTDLVPMPRAGSDVSFENGRPLAAQVAAALGVSVVALLSDPGAAGSSYGSAQTLDTPTIIVMATIQESWKAFYKEIFRKTKGADVSVEFPSIENDPVYRQIQSLMSAYSTGGITQGEYRAAILDLLDVQQLTEGLPKPDNFNNAHLTPDEIAKNAQKAADTAAAAKASSDPVARQGNTGTGGNRGETDNSGRTDTQSTGDNA